MRRSMTVAARRGNCSRASRSMDTRGVLVLPQVVEFLRKEWGSGLALPRVASSFSAWAQAVAGSNPVAPTTSLTNLHNTQQVRELAESSAVLAICLASPRIAGFRIEVGTAKPHLSDANVGGCRKRAARTGHTRRRAGARGGFYVR